MSDVPRPLKQLPRFRFYRRAEKNLQQMIYMRFGLSPFEPDEIKIADREMLAEEAMSPKLMSPLHPDWRARCDPKIYFTPLLPKKAEELFLTSFERFFGKD